MFSFLTYNFVIIALATALIIALASALLSPFLVLNEQALIADGLAHVGFTGLAVGILFSEQPLLISIPIVIVASVIVKYLADNKNINGDAALGILSTISLAIGLVIIHKSTGFNRSIEGMLVGSLWTISLTELFIALSVLLLIGGFLLINYQKLLLLTFDYKYAKFKKIKVKLISYTLAILTAVLITIGVKTIGTLLISSFVIFPVLIGMQSTTSFKKTLLIGAISSAFAVIIGIFTAHLIDIPAGASIVLVYALILIVTMLSKKIMRRSFYRA